jgi:hypothetical protein
MDASKVELARTELDFLRRLLLDVQRHVSAGSPASSEEMVAALELALALLHWEGDTPAELDAQVGLGAAVQLKLGGDGMCAYRQWRNERRKRLATHSVR